MDNFGHVAGMGGEQPTERAADPALVQAASSRLDGEPSAVTSQGVVTAAAVSTSAAVGGAALAEENRQRRTEVLLGEKGTSQSIPTAPLPAVVAGADELASVAASEENFLATNPASRSSPVEAEAVGVAATPGTALADGASDDGRQATTIPGGDVGSARALDSDAVAGSDAGPDTEHLLPVPPPPEASKALESLDVPGLNQVANETAMAAAVVVSAAPPW